MKDWRGRAQVTRIGELTHLLNIIKASKNDSFCDLGCGYGHLCIHARKWVGNSAGFETKKSRYKIAKNRVIKSIFDNIKIYNKSYTQKKSIKIIKKYNIIFSVNGLTKEYIQKLEKIVKNNSKIILYDLPPPPIKPFKKIGWYFILKTPFPLAKSEKNWIIAVSGHKGKTRQELAAMIRNNFRKDYSDRIQIIEEELNSVFLKKKL